MAALASNGAPLAGVELAMSRFVSGLQPDYAWTATTDANGEAEIQISASGSPLDRRGISGYYTIKATDATGSPIGEWSSIPINAGDEMTVQLPLGGQAVLRRGICRAIYAFGDSYIDAGNFFEATGHTFPPDPPYWSGRWMNGPNFVDVLAERLGLGPIAPSQRGGTNYGFGGATVAADWDYEGILVKSAKTQVKEYLEGLNGAAADRRGLYVFFVSGITTPIDTGMDEASARAYAVQAASDVVFLVKALVDRGARSFLVVQQPDMALVPIPGYQGNALLTELCGVFNGAVTAGLADLNGVSVVDFDFRTWMAGIQSEFAVTDVLFLSQTTSTNADEYLWFDDFGHLTARANRMLGDAMAKAVVRGNKPS